MTETDRTYEFVEPPGSAYEIRLNVFSVGHPEKAAHWQLKRCPVDAADFRAIIADFLAQLNNIQECARADPPQESER